MTPPKITKQFNQERLMNILLGPQVSEKATYVGDKHKQVIFRVTTDATKPEIKAAVELMFKVNVEGVQVAVVKGKKKRFGSTNGLGSLSLCPAPECACRCGKPPTLPTETIGGGSNRRTCL